MSRCGEESSGGDDISCWETGRRHVSGLDFTISRRASKQSYSLRLQKT
jgi:hypothetical protein